MHEGMYQHGILHRIEGDFDNARAWYRDVAESEVYKAVWQGKGMDGQALIDETENLVSKSKSGKGIDEADLARRSQGEILAVIDFCVKKFGTEKVHDASSNWKQPDGEKKKLGQEMVSGSKGHREF